MNANRAKGMVAAVNAYSYSHVVFKIIEAAAMQGHRSVEVSDKWMTRATITALIRQGYQIMEPAMNNTYIVSWI